MNSYRYMQLQVDPTLTNVYVGTASTVGSPAAPLITDLLLPSGTTTTNSGQNVSPAGFTVTGGNTQYNLTPLTRDTTGDNDFAVVGLHKDPSAVTHVVIGTNLNLNAEAFPFDCPGGCTDATYDGWLTSGLLGAGEGTEIGGAQRRYRGLLEDGGFAPMGSTVKLWQFTTGTQIVGASVTANTFGTPIGTTGTVPEPATLLLLGTGLAGLAFARTRRAGNNPR